MDKTKKAHRWLSKSEALSLGQEPKTPKKGRKKSRYYVTPKQWESIQENRKESTQVSTESDTKANDYEPFFLSAYCKETNTILSIEDFCKKYNQDFSKVSSYKFLPYHYKEPSYNIVIRETTKEVEEFDFDSIIAKHVNSVKPVKVKKQNNSNNKADFDTLTYSDVHIGMDTNSSDNSMYPVEWNKETILEAANRMIELTLQEQQSNTLVVDELGDFFDGYNAQTTRGGHALPQNMTNEESFDCGLEFKITLLEGLVGHYDSILFNNICNDNHAGAFGYFVNSAFKEIAEARYPNLVKVENHRKFINHYYMGDTCYIITHGKDDSTLKFGFKPFLDSKAIEKIDQYCKQNGIYKNSEKVVFKKGDSHQALFDMCTSDDFFYFNYPALSPSSQWVQNNFKKGRRGFILESSTDNDITLKIKLK